MACTRQNEVCSASFCVCPPSNPSVCDAACTDTQRDAKHCGTCGHACAEGEACGDGVCCPQGRAGCAGACCEEGAACGCSSGTQCQTRHDRGVATQEGGPRSFFDCNPARSAAAANTAAVTWAPAGRPTTQVGDGTGCSFVSQCVARETATACGVWCYAGLFAGRFSVNTISAACLCPTEGSSTWR